jgi:hypothetical protein
MSDAEPFLSRWLRLKRESEVASPSDAPSPAAFDPASLPPIESIVADSDLQQFLQEGVPAEMTRAALRSAWTADPAIRDFVGIAENQWNFNDHASIPGFGPLEAADYLVAQALGSVANAQETPQDAEGAGHSAPLRSEPLEEVRPAAAVPVIENAIGVVATAVASETTCGEAGAGAAAPRSHGGALPQ